MIILMVHCLTIIESIYAQSVLIDPKNKASIDLSAATKPVLITGLNNQAMNGLAGSNTAPGMLIYNNEQHQYYGYMRQSTLTFNNIKFPVNKWLPISTGPRMLAWGSYDSTGVIKSGSGNFSIDWNSSYNWFELGITSHAYSRDSMLLIVTPVGISSWDQMVATFEVVVNAKMYATIKFIDASRLIANYSSTNSRRKSHFHFVLYDLRKNPF